MTMPSPRPESADRHALDAGFTIEEIFNHTKIDRWFLVQIKKTVDFEEELAGRSQSVRTFQMSAVEEGHETARK
jgi:hypothetical protein